MRQIITLILILNLLSNIAYGQIDLRDLNDNWIAFVNGSMTDFENQPIITFRNFVTAEQKDSMKNLNACYKEIWLINNDSLSVYSSYSGFGMTVSTKYENDKLSQRKFFGKITLIHSRNEDGKNKITAKYRMLDLKKEKWDMAYSFGKKDGKFKFEKLKNEDMVFYRKELILERKK